MKTLFVLFGDVYNLSLFIRSRCGVAGLPGRAGTRHESEKNRDSIAAAYCHLGEYYAYRQADSTRYYCEQGLKYAATDKSRALPLPVE